MSGIFTEYKIIHCPHCGLPQYVKVGQKSRKCPGCNKNINLTKVIIILRTKDLQKAIDIVQNLKMKKNSIKYKTALEEDIKKRQISF